MTTPYVPAVSPTPSHQLLTEIQVADRLNLSVALLRKWRGNGNGPNFLKLSRLVRYREADLNAFLHQIALEAGR
jgi:hypothetical protein